MAAGGAGGAGGSGGAGGAGGMAAGGAGGEGGTTTTAARAAERGRPEPESVTQTLYLCIPFEDFPFSEGDQIQVFDDVNRLEITGITTDRSLLVYRNQQELVLSGLTANVEASDCEGDRLECGAYVTDAALRLSVGGESSLLAPGDSMTGPGFFVRVGRAERIVAGREECDSGYETPNVSADFLIAYE